MRCTGIEHIVDMGNMKYTNVKPVKGLPAAGVALPVAPGAEAVEVDGALVVVLAPPEPPVLLPGRHCE